MQPRTQYAHPDRPRAVAVAKPRGPFKRIDVFRGPIIVYPPKFGGERGKYKPHQSIREMERRCRQMYGEDR